MGLSLYHDVPDAGFILLASPWISVDTSECFYFNQTKQMFLDEWKSILFACESFQILGTATYFLVKSSCAFKITIYSQ